MLSQKVNLIDIQFFVERHCEIGLNVLFCLELVFTTLCAVSMWWCFCCRHGAHNWEGPGLLTAMTALESLADLTAKAVWIQNKADNRHIIYAGNSGDLVLYVLHCFFFIDMFYVWLRWVKKSSHLNCRLRCCTSWAIHFNSKLLSYWNSFFFLT